MATEGCAAALLAIIDARFGSNFYAAARVLRDKTVLEQLFTCQALTVFLTKYKPSAGELNLRTEFQWLKDNMIFSPSFWKKLTLYVKFTEFQIVGLRRSDVDSANLHLIYVCFETAHLQCTKLAREAIRDDPGLYVEGFPEKVAAVFVARKDDIVTQLARAAAFVDPAGAYLDTPLEVMGGFTAMSSVLTKYYQGDAGQIAEAISRILKFREHRGEWFSSAVALNLARRPNADDFWAAAVNAEGKLGFEVCRFLVNAYAGQGAAERMNKRIKYVRSVEQNRQTHQVTEAYVEIGMGLQLGSGPPPKTYLQFRKEQFDDLRALRTSAAAEAAAAAAAPAAAAAEGEEGNDEGDVEDEEEEDEEVAMMEAIEEEVVVAGGDVDGVVAGVRE
jgi:hypothetical protein